MMSTSIIAAAWIGTLVHGWSGEAKRYELIRDAGIGIVLRCEVQWKDCEKEKGKYGYWPRLDWHLF